MAYFQGRTVSFREGRSFGSKKSPSSYKSSKFQSKGTFSSNQKKVQNCDVCGLILDFSRKFWVNTVVFFWGGDLQGFLGVEKTI